jgi:hypothetical protein
MQLRIELADEITKLKKSSSVWMSAFFTLLFTAAPILMDQWNNLPQDLKDALPHGTARTVAVSCFALTFLSRVTRVTARKKEEQDVATQS